MKSKDKRVEIVVKIEGVEVAYEHAREIWMELNKIFGKDTYLTTTQGMYNVRSPAHTTPFQEEEPPF